MVRLRLPRPLRTGLVALAAALFLAVFARSARGEEAIVLDNGAVLRGTVVREDPTTIVFKLSGVGTDSRITISREHIAQRFVTVDPNAWTTGSQVARPSIPDPAASPALLRPAEPRAAKPATLPAEEPAVHEEGFFQRTARRAALAFPTDPGSRTSLAVLAMVILLCLVGLGGKMADLSGLTLGRNTLLALFLGALVAVDVAWGPSILRADMAAMILPVQVLAWAACAAAILKCGFGRAFQLLSFVLLAGALVTFSTGAVLVLV